MKVFGYFRTTDGFIKLDPGNFFCLTGLIFTFKRQNRSSIEIKDTLFRAYL
jgi:hypothetical protein